MEKTLEQMIAEAKTNERDSVRSLSFTIANLRFIQMIVEDLIELKKNNQPIPEDFASSIDVEDCIPSAEVKQILHDIVDGKNDGLGFLENLQKVITKLAENLTQERLAIKKVSGETGVWSSALDNTFRSWGTAFADCYTKVQELSKIK